MNVAARAISTTVRAAVVAGRPYNVVKCSLGNAAIRQMTPLLAWSVMRVPGGTVSVTVPAGGALSRFSPSNCAAEWWLATPLPDLVSLTATTSSACRKPGSVSARAMTLPVA